MYTIIGGDGKEYPGVSADILHQWIAEGRLNAQSMCKADGGMEFRPLSTFAEFAGAFIPTGAASVEPQAAVDFEGRDYELDIGGCISRGWELYKNNFGMLFGSLMLAMLMLMAIGGMFGFFTALLIPRELQASAAYTSCFTIVSQVVTALVSGPLFGGVFFIFLQTLRGRPAGIGDLFIGYQRAFPQLYLGQLVLSVFVGLCFVPFNFIYAAKVEPILLQMNHGAPSDMHNRLTELWLAMFGTLPVLVICIIPMIYIAVSLQFTLPLIIDKSLNFWPAMKTSWKMVHRHWWQVFGIIFVASLISMVGFFGCCIGVIFTMPIFTAVLMCAYETIFCSAQKAAA